MTEHAQSGKEAGNCFERLECERASSGVFLEGNEPVNPAGIRHVCKHAINGECNGCPDCTPSDEE
jgi:hypothetical protein